MEKTLLRRKYFYASLFLLLVLSVYSLHKPTDFSLSAPPLQELSEKFKLKEAPSALGTKEDPFARIKYEQRMLVDPVTGKIPDDIREKELNFARKLPNRKSKGFSYRSVGLEETEWKSAGPFNVGGRTRAMAIDASNESIILAGGVSGGMWRSTDGGNSWTRTTDPQKFPSTTCLIQDTRSGKTNTWYYGTGELVGNSARGGQAPYRGNGIYKSTDGGVTWNSLPSTSSALSKFDSFFDYVFNLKINTTNTLTDELYAAAVGGIFLSVDGGTSWTLAVGDEVSLFTDIEITKNGVIYASLSSSKLADESVTPDQYKTGIYRSEDGINWTNITPGDWPRAFDRTVIGANPTNSNEVYFLVDSEAGPQLWRYNHDKLIFNRWANLSINLPDFGGEVGALDLQNSYNMLVKVHPTQNNSVFIGGTNLYRSDDGFTSKNNTYWIGGYSTKNDVSLYPNHHPDQHDIEFYTSDPAKSISAHDGGLSRTDNVLAKEVVWKELNRGYITSQFYTVGLDQNQMNDVIIGGMQDNGSYITGSANRESLWTRIIGGDGGYTHVAFKGSYYYVSFQNSQIYRVSLGPDFKITSFARVDPVGAGEVQDQEYLFINPYVFDPNNNNRMYLAGGNVIYRNRNLSQIPNNNNTPTNINWDVLNSTAIQKGSISAVAISTFNVKNVLYYGSSIGEVFRVDSASTNPMVSKLSSTSFPKSGYVAHIAVNPFNSQEIIVVFSNYEVESMFHSTDGGKNFTPIGGNLEPTNANSEPDKEKGPSVRYAEIIPLRTGETLYLAGTSTGLYSTLTLNGNSTTWVQEGPETIGRVVVPMLRYRSLDGRVVAATHANGVYYKNFDNVLPLDEKNTPAKLDLFNPYPNPFNPRMQDLTIIPYNLPFDGTVRIRIYDALGQVVKTLIYGKQFIGKGEVTWDGTGATGARVSEGVYYVRLEFGDQDITKRIVLVK